jgi:hypothetical protein
MTITAPVTGAASTARAVLGRAKAAVLARKQADVDLLAAAVEWAAANPAPSAHDVAGWGEGVMYGEGFLPLAGEGAPLVAEFAPFELAAALGWTPDATRSLIGDGLELAHRLPALYAKVRDLKISVSTARYASQHTRDLGPEAAADADGLLAGAVGSGYLTSARIRALVDEARLYHDPDRALDDEHHALTHRRVDLKPGQAPATVEVAMVLDTADAEAFDQTVGQVAETLGKLGDTDSLDIRRARAVGILADPQPALDLFTADVSDDQKRRRLATRAPKPATLYLHLDESGLSGIDTFPAAVTVQGLPHGLSVVSSDLLAMWLQGSTVIVKPVIDLTHPEQFKAVDAHDPPETMAEYVRLRDPVCVFPSCQRPSRHCDLDHIEEYLDPDDGGPPGQTHPDNLAPLCRGHHRAKTHGHWDYTQLPDDSYLWTSPTGDIYAVPARPWR